MIFSEALERASRELPNQINEFGAWIRNLEAWDLVIDGFDKKEIFMLSSEHIEGLTSLAISAPQAIRGQMLYAAVECAALANPFVGRPHDWKGGHIDMKRAKKVAEAWKGWPRLAATLTALQAEELNKASSNFRNDKQHGAPRTLIIGLNSRTTWLAQGEGKVG